MKAPVTVAATTEETQHLIDAARAVWARARDEGPADEAAKALIDEVIYAFATQGRPFSSNDFRRFLPEGVRHSLVPGRLRAAMAAGWIRHAGYTPSTLRSARGHPVAVYIPIPGGLT